MTKAEKQDMIEKLSEWFGEALDSGKNIVIKQTKAGITVYAEGRKLLYREDEIFKK